MQSAPVPAGAETAKPAPARRKRDDDDEEEE